MLAAWAGGTDGNLFPLRRNTAYRITFEKSINIRHSIRSCWCPRAFITQQTSLQNTRSFSWEKNLEFILTIATEIYYISWWRRSRHFSLEPKSSACFTDRSDHGQGN